MSVQALRDLRKAIVNRRFEPVYYFHGDDEFRKDRAIRELTAAAVDPGTRDFNLDLLRGTDVSPEQVEVAFHTPPMMADRRVVVLREIQALRKDTRTVVDRYLEHPAGDTVVLLVASSGAKADKELERATTAVAFGALDAAALPEWIVHHATEVHGVEISASAVRLLVEAVGDSTALLASELDKLASYTGGKPIDEDAVGDVVGVRRGETLSDFFDRVAARDVDGALALVEHVLSLPKSGLVPVIIGLTVQTLALGWAQHARERGMSEHRLKSEFFPLLKETGAYPMRAWGEAADCWARNASRWDAASIDRALETLLAADRSAKDTRVSSDEQLLASIVCALSTPTEPMSAGRPRT